MVESGSVDRPARFAATGGKAPLIAGVKTKRLRLIPDERGWLMEILRGDDAEFFDRFGQVYVSATYPGVVKAWHYHKRQVDNFACVSGMVKLVLVDTRAGSPTAGAVNEFFVEEKQRFDQLAALDPGGPPARLRASALSLPGQLFESQPHGEVFSLG